jgi:peptidoglycan/xylan/chitin deacetylase (PgdA/CDA1 family)
MTMTATIKRTLKRGAKAGLCVIADAAARRVPDVRVLEYHSIDETGSSLSVSPERFREHLTLLRDRGCKSIRMEQFIKRVAGDAGDAGGAGSAGNSGGGECEVLITFDDAYQNFYTSAAPLLEEFRFPATVFVPTDFVGERPGWTQRDAATIDRFLASVGLGEPERRRVQETTRVLAEAPLMDWAQLRELAGRGFDIHSHSAAHHFLTALPDEPLMDDLRRAREAIRANLNSEPDVICYPYGDCDDRVAKFAEGAGYRVGFLAEYYGPSRDPMRVSRSGLGGSGTTLDLRFALSPACDYVAAWRARRPAPRTAAYGENRAGL